MSTLLEQASLVMIPSGYKEDVVYSQIPTDGSGDLSFSRASNGTRINSAGLVEVCPWNLLQYSEDFTQYPPWLIQNITRTANVATAPNGTNTANKIYPSTTSSNPVLYTTAISVQSGIDYAVSIYAKADGKNWIFIRTVDDNSPGVWFNLSTGTIGTQTSATGTIESVGNGWYRCTVVGAPTTTGGRAVYLVVDSNGTTTGTASGTDGILIWGAQLNIGSTAKPYFPTTDRLNVPRLTYQNGGGGCPSLLLEKQSTNLITYSEDFTNAAWLRVGGNVDAPAITANQTISPDGTQNADKIVFPSVQNSGDFSVVYRAADNLSGTNTTSIYLKGENGGEQVYLYYFISSYNNKLCTLTTEWQRFDLTFEGGAASYWHIGVDLRSGSGQSAKPAQTIYAWGAQLEASSYPTSYIGPTTSASATRVADLSTSDTIQTAQTFAGDFTFFVDFVSFTTTDGLGPTNQMILGGGNQALGASYKSYFWIEQGAIILTGDSETAMIAVNKVFNANQRYKLLVKRNGTTIKVFCDGVQVGSSGTSSLSISIRSIGWSYSSNYIFNGLINEVVLSATGFSDSDCQSLTTI